MRVSFFVVGFLGRGAGEGVVQRRRKGKEKYKEKGYIHTLDNFENDNHSLNSISQVSMLQFLLSYKN